ncbi:MAG: ferrous iron transport protein B [Pelosinus sp.]|nr:ferrous iron transport protein B [Pelosinus sp.]
MLKENVTVALAGNPNCGKTSIFNNITGARQHVGNYPGVTVERREGTRRFQGKELLMVDLPGTYSLTAHSLDELVARNVIIDEKPDIIVNILDASNLERNLYLAVQLLEMESPMVFALNMMDVAEKNGEKVDDNLLSEKLGVPVVQTIASRNEGTDILLKTVLKATTEYQSRPFHINYGSEIEGKITELSLALKTLTNVKYPLRWLAVKLLENDQDVYQTISNRSEGQLVLALVAQNREYLKSAFQEEIDLVIAERRYNFVADIYKAVTAPHSHMAQTVSDRIDSILTHRVLGLPLFLAIMWLLFNLVFTMGDYPKDWIESGFAALGHLVGQYMADSDLKSLLVDGVIGGVGSVLSFLPNILILFLGIALLEDTGYMARAAFVMDRIMRAVGLHGKSFIPLLLGFGCSVPAIMGTRTLENPKDRMVTMLVAPLMSCSARLPVYTLLAAAFFSERTAGTVLFSVYFLGIVLAVLMALIFRKFLFAGDSEAFVMEMPPYHIPTIRSMATHMWERGVLYLKKAGTLILAATILVWFMTNYPTNIEYSKDYDQLKEAAEAAFTEQVAVQVLAPLQLGKVEDNAALSSLISDIKERKVADNWPEKLAAEDTALYPYAFSYVDGEEEKEDHLKQLEKEQAAEKLSNGYAGQLGHLVEPVIQPLGFDWKMGVGLVSAMAAKEVLVSTLGTIYSVGDVADDNTSLQDALANDPSFNPLVAYSLMVFTLIYSPCFSALAVMRRETNSWKWTGFTFLYSTVLAWVVTFIVYQAGLLLGY